MWSDNPCVGGATIGNTCSVSSLCEPGLVCHALTVWEEGFCRDDGDNGRFFGFGGAVPDNDPTGLVVTVEASGLASVPEDAILSLELSHPDPSQLVITLANPLGTPTVVWDHGDGAGSELMLTLPVFAPGDEDANGTWTLTVVDDVAGDSGDLEAWDLELTSRFD
jgi:subtilisin-like proprotein convertase family protein